MDTPYKILPLEKEHTHTVYYLHRKVVLQRNNTTQLCSEYHHIAPHTVNTVTVQYCNTALHWIQNAYINHDPGSVDGWKGAVIHQCLNVPGEGKGSSGCACNTVLAVYCSALVRPLAIGTYNST